MTTKIQEENSAESRIELKRDPAASEAGRKFRFRDLSKLQMVFLIGLLTFVANLSQVGAFLLEYYQNINLNPPVFIVGSNTVLGEGLGVAGVNT